MGVKGFTSTCKYSHLVLSKYEFESKEDTLELFTGEVVRWVLLYLSLRQGREDVGLNPK